LGFHFISFLSSLKQKRPASVASLFEFISMVKSKHEPAGDAMCMVVQAMNVLVVVHI
jgi:hypothetical protein